MAAEDTLSEKVRTTGGAPIILVLTPRIEIVEEELLSLTRIGRVTGVTTMIEAITSTSNGREKVNIETAAFMETTSKRVRLRSQSTLVIDITQR